MEKTKKTNTKPAKKQNTVKEVVKKNDEVIVKNQIDYTNILNRIFISLVVIAVLLFINLTVTVFTKTMNNSTETKDQTTEDYDISDLNEMTVNDALKQIEKGKTEVVFIGRSSCGYCVKFLPIVKEVQKELGFKHIYINLEKMDSDGYDALAALDSYISDNLGATPMVLVFKDGKFVKGTVGYTDATTYKSFLNEQGIK